MRRFAKVCCLFVAVALGSDAVVADELELTSGEVLKGRLIDITSNHVIFEHEVLGQFVVPTGRVRKLTTDEDGVLPLVRLGGDDPDAAAADGEPVEIDLDGEGFFANWEGSISLGFSGTDGDTRTNSVNSQFRARRETDEHRWLINAGYFYGRDGSASTQNEFRSELTKDWLLPESPMFLFAQGNYDFDHFRGWRHRFGAYAGLGYEVIKEDDLELVARIGAGSTYEVRGGRKFTPEALLGASLLRWNITENQRLTGSLTIFPNLEDLGEYRITSGLEWQVLVSEVDGLSVKLGIENQYESDPLPGSRHNNLKYYGAVVFEF
ncbi:YdiY family protein [Phycisphaerales bacterium AB-hyl4]|uniref:YdiY family protein n=1 Tax=Natronomicrosphaera hydrolytica TaxID=3242702 RepID=A0ABV4U6B5_9BACT